MTIANNAAVDTTVEEMVIVPVRESVAIEIHALLDSIGKSYLEVGKLLAEAREDFEDQKSFLAWAEAEFSIKKAQCYNLMNVARVFGEDDRFDGVSMRVMLALIPMADDAQVMDKAASIAAVGALDTNAVNELLGKPKAPIKLVQSTQEEMNEAADAAGKAIVDAARNVTEGADYGGWKEPTGMQIAPVAPDVPNVEATPNPVTVGVQDATMQALLDQNKRLSSQLEEAMQRIAELSSPRETKKAVAPMLPQFKSKCLYARLGLSAEQATSKSAINKARRELVKIGYGEGHEAWAAISEAVEKLSVSAE